MYNKNDEQYVCYLLKTFGALPAELLIKLMRIDERSARFLLEKMIRTKNLYITSDNLMGLHSGYGSRKELIMALWLLSEYSDEIGKYSFYKSLGPYELSFIMHNRIYRIAVVNEEADFKIISFMKNESYFVIVSDEKLLFSLEPEQSDKIVYVVPIENDTVKGLKTKKYIYKGRNEDE